MRAALERLGEVAGVIAAIDMQGERIEPPEEAWHELDDALEQAAAALDEDMDVVRGRVVVGSPNFLETEMGRLMHDEWHDGELNPNAPKECGTLGCGFLGRILALEQEASGKA